MNYKLVCIDMDGTLLNNRHQVTDLNRKALKEAVEGGVKIAITTGRLYTSASLYAEMIGVKVAVISSNGTYIREKGEGKCIYKHPMNRDEFSRVCDIIEKYNVRTNFNTYNKLIGREHPPVNNAYMISNKTAPEHLKVGVAVHKNIREAYDIYEGEILKAIMFPQGPEMIEKIKKELIEMGGLEVVSSGPDNIEIMAEGTSKGSGVKAFSEILGVDKKEIICIGDHENDISMVTYAGLGIAMGNAVDSLKKVADYVTDDNENSGVGKAINKFILNK